METTSFDPTTSPSTEQTAIPAVDLAISNLQEAEAQFKQTVDVANLSLQDAEAQFTQALAAAIGGLGPKIDATWSRIKVLKESLASLQKNPIPPSEFGEFIVEYVDALAKKGEAEIANYLNGRVANIVDAQSPNAPKDFSPLSFRQIEMLLSGDQVGPVRSPLPVMDNGALSPEVTMFLLGDLVTAKLGELLKDRPVVYSTSLKGGFQVGSGITTRRTEIAAAQDELQRLEADYKKCGAEMAALQQKRRAKG